jgi:hypothetical protein
MEKINGITVDITEYHETQQKLVSLHYMEARIAPIDHTHPDLARQENLTLLAQANLLAIKAKAQLNYTHDIYALKSGDTFSEPVNITKSGSASY